MTPYQKAGFNELSLFRVKSSDTRSGQVVWISEDDESMWPFFDSVTNKLQCRGFADDLQELTKDKDGFYLWDGGECPVPEGWDVKVMLSSRVILTGQATCFEWSRRGIRDDIIAFKPLSRPDMPSVAECATEEVNVQTMQEETVDSELVLPKDIWDHRRKETLKSGIVKALGKGHNVPIEWVEEYNELVEEE